VTDLDIAVADELLSTTRSIRKKLDLERPVDPALIDECIELSLQAPTGSNAQGWRWIVVTDEKLRAGLADIYRRASAGYFAKQAEALQGDEVSQNAKVYSSAQYLVDVLHRVPVHVIPCIRGRVSDNAFANASMYGSILPAVWSFMLAARARNLGTVYTTLSPPARRRGCGAAGDPRAVPPDRPRPGGTHRSGGLQAGAPGAARRGQVP
jgi:nitroreductase